MLEIYQEPLFVLFPLYSLGIGFLSFLFFALPYSWISWRNPSWAIPYRIQSRQMSADEVFWPSFTRFVINAVCSLILAVLLWPLLRLGAVHAVGMPSWHEILWQVPLFLIIDDIGFYFLHRALHTRWLYKRVHAIHHRAITPWAISGGYFHPIEYLLITLLALTGPLLVGAHVMTIWIWAVFRQWLAAEGHSGYEFPWNPTRWFPGYEGAAFHDFHHKKFVGNYANYFGFLDRFFNTESPDYQLFRSNARDPK